MELNPELGFNIIATNIIEELQLQGFSDCNIYNFLTQYKEQSRVLLNLLIEEGDDVELAAHAKNMLNLIK